MSAIEISAPASTPISGLDGRIHVLVDANIGVRYNSPTLLGGGNIVTSQLEVQDIFRRIVALADMLIDLVGRDSTLRLEQIESKVESRILSHVSYFLCLCL